MKKTLMLLLAALICSVGRVSAENFAVLQWETAVSNLSRTHSSENRRKYQAEFAAGYNYAGSMLELHFITRGITNDCMLLMHEFANRPLGEKKQAKVFKDGKWAEDTEVEKYNNRVKADLESMRESLIYAENTSIALNSNAASTAAQVRKIVKRGEPLDVGQAKEVGDAVVMGADLLVLDAEEMSNTCQHFKKEADRRGWFRRQTMELDERVNKVGRANATLKKTVRTKFYGVSH